MTVPRKSFLLEMQLTRDFKEAIRNRVQRDSAFRAALIKEAIEAFLSGDVETVKAVLRDFIEATIRYDKLSKSEENKPKP